MVKKTSNSGNKPATKKVMRKLTSQQKRLTPTVAKAKLPSTNVTGTEVVSVPVAASISDSLLGKTVFIYSDDDHGECKAFATLGAAKTYAEKQWPEDDGDQTGNVSLWTTNNGYHHFSRTDYVKIYESVVS